MHCAMSTRTSSERSWPAVPATPLEYSHRQGRLGSRRDCSAQTPPVARPRAAATKCRPPSFIAVELSQRQGSFCAVVLRESQAPHAA